MSQTPSASAEIDHDNPWPGLSSFTEGTRGFFFGRDKETDELARLVRRETLTVLFGQSGLGKSSLLQAGLFPLLRDTDHLPLYLRLDHDENAPALAEQVKAALNAAFAEAKADAPPLGAEETLWEYFHRKDVDIWSAKNRLLTPVLAFDQFEEIFTLGRADDTRRERSRAFLAELADLVENRPPAALKARFEAGTAEPTRYNFDKPSCRVILSLREDFLPDLEGLKQSLPALIHNRLRLKRLNGAQALEAVTRPAPHLLAEGVGEKIVEFVAGARGGSAERLLEMEVEPALLSVICRELNDKRRTLGQAQITADLVSGNRREILTQFYERSVADLPEAMRTFVEDHLLTKSGFRDNLALETALEFPGVTRELIDTLVARRLLRIEDRAGIQRVELTHDVLADVVRGARDARQQRLALAEAARRTRRMRVAITGLVAVVVALSIGAVFGIRAQRRATGQAARGDLLLGSQTLDEGKLGEGIAYLVAAARKDPSNPIIAPRLLTELAARNFLLPEKPPLALPSPAVHARFTSDGRRVVVQGEDRVLRVINAETWTLEREIRFAQHIAAGGWQLPDLEPTRVLVTLEDGAFLPYDLASGRALSAPIASKDQVRGARMVISPDGQWIVTRVADGAGLWSATTGERRATFPAGANSAYDFSRDSRQLATMFQGSQSWSVPEATPIGANIAQATQSRGRVFSPDGSQIFVRYSQAVRAYDVASGEPVGPLIAFQFDSQGHRLSPDGNRLLVFSSSKAVVIDLVNQRLIGQPFDVGELVVDSTLSHRGDVLLVTSADGLFRLWDVATGKLLAEPTFKQERFSPAALSPDGRRVVAFTAGHAHLLRLTHGEAQPLVLPRAPSVALVNLAPGVPTRVAWVTPTHYRAIDAASGRDTPESFAFPTRILGPAGTIRSTYGQTFGAGDSLVLFTARSGNSLTWRTWTLGERKLERDAALQNVPTDVEFFRPSQTGRIAAASGAGPNRNNVGVWDLDSGRRIAWFAGAAPVNPQPTTISPDRKLVAYLTNDLVVHIGEIETGKELVALQLTEGRASLSSFRFMPDSRHIVTGDTWGGVHVWDARSGNRLKSSQAHRGQVRRFDFSPDQQCYVSISMDGSVQPWNSTTHEPIGDLFAGSGTSAGGRADFNVDNTRIVTPTRGNAARVWDVSSGLPLTPSIAQGGDTPTIVAYGPDGRFFEIHGQDTGSSRIRVWAAPPAEHGAPTPRWLLDLATICAGRRLTDEGKFESALDQLDRMASVRTALAALPASDAYAEWGRWFLSHAADRAIAPGFTITPKEAAALADKMTAEAEAERGEQNRVRDAIAALNERATPLRQERRWPELEPIERELLQLMRAGRGIDTPAFDAQLIRLAVTLLRSEKPQEAAAAAREALDIRESRGAGAGPIATARASLGLALAAQGKHAEAEPLLKQSYSANFGAAAPISREDIAQALASIYTAMNQPAAAEEWKQRATAPRPAPKKK